MLPADWSSLSPEALLDRVRSLPAADKAELDRLLFGRAERVKPFQAWLAEVSPTWTWTWPHLVHVQQQLARLTTREIDRLAVFMPPRHGKPVYNESMILLSSGELAKIESVRVGDHVVTHRGRPRRVLAVHDQGPLPVLRITTESGRSTVAAHSHPFLTADGWRRADELRPGMTLANVPRPECGGGDGKSLEEYRLAGYFVGDGKTGPTNSGAGFGASVICFDPEQVPDIYACASAMGFSVYCAPADDGEYQLSGGVRDWLRESGLAGKRAPQKTVPPWVFRGSREQIANFLGAYFACDGSVNQRGKARKDACVEFYSSSPGLLPQIQHLLLRVGVQSTLRRKNSKYKGEPYVSWRLSITSQDDAARFVACVPVVGQKAAKLAAWGLRRTRFDEPLLPDPVVSVEDAGVLPCRCLEVEEDHTFTSDDLVVHNTEQNTVRYPAWRLERDPALRVILGAHTQKLANKFSRKIRKVALGRVPLSAERNAAEEWETAEGGGVRAVGVGGAVAGVGADLIVLDDPIRSAEEALSEACREAVWDWYVEDIYTRREPGCGILLMVTRWHEDDLPGRILASDDAPHWSVVSLPALAEEGDPLGRPVGRALCPERYDEAALADIARVMGASFHSLYQQTPVPRSGGLFQRSWFGHFVYALPKGCAFVRYWDKAGTDGDGCYTAGVLLARDKDGFFYVVDVVRAQLAYHEREKLIRLTAELDRMKYGGVSTYFETEGGSAGKDVAGLAIRNLAGFHVEADRVTGNKEARALPFAAQCGAGNVRILKSADSAWINPFVNELCLFPRGKFKDQVDAASGAFNRLAQVVGPIILGHPDPKTGGLVNQAPPGVFAKT